MKGSNDQRAETLENLNVVFFVYQRLALLNEPKSSDLKMR